MTERAGRRFPDQRHPVRQGGGSGGDGAAVTDPAQGPEYVGANAGCRIPCRPDQGAHRAFGLDQTEAKRRHHPDGGITAREPFRETRRRLGAAVARQQPHGHLPDAGVLDGQTLQQLPGFRRRRLAGAVPAGAAGRAAA